MEAKAPYYLIHDREVTSLCRSGCPQESSNEWQNFETLTLLILGDLSRDACYSLLAYIWIYRGVKYQLPNDDESGTWTWNFFSVWSTVVPLMKGNS